MLKKLLVTGGSGLVGRALQELHYIRNACPTYDLTAVNTFTGGDLTCESNVRKLFQAWSPEYVIHCAAVVGGILFNKNHPDRLFRDNILMNTHMIHVAHQFNVKKMIAFSSACAFPDGIYPIHEELLQEGKPYEGNLAYGYAKRMVDVQIRTYNKLHNTNYCTVIPVSIYGPGDNFNLHNGHFVAALIHKAYLAKKNNTELRIWGDGTPLREMLFSLDLAKILMHVLDTDPPHDRLMITSGQEVSVKDMALAVAELMDFEGEVVFETDKPSGQYRKPADPKRMKEVIGDFDFTPWKQGLKITIDWFLENYPNVRV